MRSRKIIILTTIAILTLIVGLLSAAFGQDEIIEFCLITLLAIAAVSAIHSMIEDKLERLTLEYLCLAEGGSIL